jgi:hypothetical protein
VADKTSVEAGQVYNQEQEGKKIEPNVFFGTHFEDNLSFLDLSTSKDGQPTL